MYCTYYISSVLICICTINKDYYNVTFIKISSMKVGNIERMCCSYHQQIFIHENACMPLCADYRYLS